MKTHYDVIIVGAGMAGLMTALQLAPDMNVLLLSKGSYQESNSYLAQGGIAAAVGKQDSPEKHYRDTLACGHGHNCEKAVMTMVKGASQAISKLEDWGVEFDQNHEGYKLGMEGAHQERRILRIGDHTGRSVMDMLYRQVQTRDFIHHLPYAEVVELIVEENECHGVKVFYRNELKVLYASSVVLATGGVGHLFAHTTNATGIDGSGVAMAIYAGAKGKNLSQVQFHPTGFYEQAGDGRHFLISEAVRGEGAYLINAYGERFVLKDDPRGELAPRDIVSQSILKEMHRTGKDHVYLDVRHFPVGFFKERFPQIEAYCCEKGIDPSYDLIPVVPCMHYYMGGIQATFQGETSLKNLYAIGECACTGVHGANRLASNSLLEIAVFSECLAENLSEKKSKKSLHESEYSPSSILVDRYYLVESQELSHEKIYGELKSEMQNNLAVNRKEKNLFEFQNRLSRLLRSRKEPSRLSLADLLMEQKICLLHAMVSEAIEKVKINEKEVNAG